MGYVFLPRATVSFTGINQNPLSTPPWQSEVPEGANTLRRLNNACQATSNLTGPGVPSVSAMLYEQTGVGTSAYVSVTIRSLVNEVQTETSIDVILKTTTAVATGYTTEISRNANGGYHFDCIKLGTGQLVFSEDFTQVPANGDVVTVVSYGLVQMVFLNGTLMVSGTATGPDSTDVKSILQLNAGVELTDPTITEYVLGQFSET